MAGNTTECQLRVDADLGELSAYRRLLKRKVFVCG